MNRRPSSAGTEAAPVAADGPSFEAAIKRLSEIVQTLERGDLPLEESLRLFEEGVKLSRVSQQRLDSAEKRVEQLLAVDEQGRARTQPFATDSADEGPPRRRRPALLSARAERFRENHQGTRPRRRHHEKERGGLAPPLGVQPPIHPLSSPWCLLLSLVPWWFSRSA